MDCHLYSTQNKSTARSLESTVKVVKSKDIISDGTVNIIKKLSLPGATDLATESSAKVVINILVSFEV